MMRYYLFFFGLLALQFDLSAQIDPLLLRIQPSDTSGAKLNMDAIYQRPFNSLGKVPVAIGGYVEANWQHLGTDGISEGHQFQFRRLSIFISSGIGKHIKFLSEIEFEDGGKEIAIEYAAMDIGITPLLNLRGGMILNPIGAFNQNHDGPKWEFIDRPIAMTQMLPGTWSNAGFGLYGKKYKNDWMIGYEAYLSGGFDHSIIDNDLNRTFLPAAKENPERFEELHSGRPLFTGKLALRHAMVAEIGLSYMGGIFNKFEEDGVQLDQKRRIHVFAIDLNSTLPNTKTRIVAEWAWVALELPSTYSQQYGDRQRGGFIDIVQPLISRNIWHWEEAIISISCRLEYLDWNVGKFRDTGGNIADELWSIVPSLSFRPISETVIRLNYRFLAQRDLLGNPPSHTGGFSLGFSTYF
ncbi:MAG: hypothetical protein ABIV51_06880 [Saprospiraceae bacterium]